MINTMPILFKILDEYKRYLRENIEIPPQEIRVLKWLDHEITTTSTLLTQKLNCDKAHITRMIKALDKQRLILKKTDELDKRKELILLTPLGQKLLLKVQQHEKLFEKSFFYKLSKDEQKQLKTLMNKLVS